MVQREIKKAHQIMMSHKDRENILNKNYFGICVEGSTGGCI
jgi:hypothetical protein